MAVTARERSFSTAGCTVSARRTALSSENVDDINSCLLIPLKFKVRNIGGAVSVVVGTLNCHAKVPGSIPGQSATQSTQL